MKEELPVGAIPPEELGYLKQDGKNYYLVVLGQKILSSDCFLFNCHNPSRGTYYFRHFFMAWAYRERTKARNAGK